MSAPERIRSETGDTLIEVLIAVVILGLCVSALLGALITSITSSAEHRSLAGDDTVLRSFAEAAQYEIQMQPNALFTNCATSYLLASAYPMSGPVGTKLTVFGTGFTSGNSVSIFVGAVLTTPLTAGQTGVTTLAVSPLASAVTSGNTIAIGSGSTRQTVTASGSAAIGTTSISVTSFTSTYAQAISAPVYDKSTPLVTGATVRTDGSLTASVTVPPTPAGSYPVLVSDGVRTAPTATNFSVTPYLGTLSPGSGPTGTSVTVAVSGFKGSSLVNVTVGGIAATITSGAMTASTGTSTVVFKIPNGLTTGTKYPVSVADGTNTTSSTFKLSASVGPVGSPHSVPSSAVANDHVTTTVDWWGPLSPGSSELGFVSPITVGSTACTHTTPYWDDIQELTITARGANGVGDSVSIVLTNPNGGPNATGYPSRPRPAPVAAVTASPPSGLQGETSTLLFTLKLTGVSTGKAPTGTIGWAFAGGQVCSSTTALSPSGNTASATCTINNPKAGTYSLAANYSGDANYSPTAGYGQATITLPVPTVTVSETPANPTPGQTLAFSATVTGYSGGPTPTGTVKWAFTAAPGTLPTCATSNLAGSGNTATTTSATACTVASASTGTYQVTATYSGDGNYQTGTSSAFSVTVALRGASVVASESPANPVPGQTLTFSATVTGTGGLHPTGTVKWTFTAAPGALPACGTSTLVGSGNTATTAPATNCTVANARAGTYKVVATYSGDGNYQTATSPPVSVTVGYPSMTVTSITSHNSHTASTAGKAESGDTISVTFSQPLSASTKSALGATGTLTLCTPGNKQTCPGSTGSHTTISIGKLVTNVATGSTYWTHQHGGTGVAPGTFSFSNTTRTVTFALTANPTGTGSVRAGTAASFSYSPPSSITDTYGTAASGTYTTTIQFF